ncbi:MAG: acetyl-CoA carboxylase biotin carboxyl carrier protein subunit, partial [Candidatus Zixiibacteriota bacterium]
ESKYRVAQLSSARYIVERNGVKTSVCCVVKDNKSYIDIDGLLLELTIPSEDGGTAAGVGGQAAAKDKIFAPMPGKIVKLLVKEGETVKAKQPMVIVEAMKMENQVNSAAEGVVKKINFKDGDQVDTETPIIELEMQS